MRPTRIAVVALLIAVLAGVAVGGLSQMTAVSVDDPRPSVPPPTPAPTVEPATPTTEPSPSPTATPNDEANVWLYTFEEGDSISGVAIRFGTTEDELLALNPAYEGNANLVEAGAQMIVPCTPIAAAEDRC